MRYTVQIWLKQLYSVIHENNILTKFNSAVKQLYKEDNSKQSNPSDYGDLRIRMKQININVNDILLIM